VSNIERIEPGSEKAREACKALGVPHLSRVIEAREHIRTAMRWAEMAEPRTLGWGVVLRQELEEALEKLAVPAAPDRQALDPREAAILELYDRLVALEARVDGMTKGGA